MPNKATHAVERVPQEALATLSQLKEVVALMERKHPQLTKRYMQDFLRFRLASPSPSLEAATSIVLSPQAPENAKILEIEELCRTHYPDVVTEVLNLCVPFFDPAFDWEFKAAPRIHDESHCESKEWLNLRARIKKAVFWDNLRDGELHEVVLEKLSVDHYNPHLAPAKPYGTQGISMPFEHGNVLNSARQTRYDLDHNWDKGAKQIASIVYKEVERKLDATKAHYYKNMRDQSESEISMSIFRALSIAIAFLGVGDHSRAETLVPFLELQRSGTPLTYLFDGKVYIMCR